MPGQLEFPPDYWLAVIEDTWQWDADTLNTYDVQRTWTVYLLNRNVEHHLCELTPSYLLVPVGFDYTGGRAQYDIPPLTFFYVQEEGTPCDPIYMHCREIDGLPHDRLIHIHSLLDQDELDTRPMLRVDCPRLDQHCSVEEECVDHFNYGMGGRWGVFIDGNGECTNTIEEVG